jgi:lysophospholipase L1-like esterase
MELKGKKINFLGDSITEGVGASEYAHCYVEQFAAATGAVCRNYGISGTRIAKRRVPYENPEFDRYYASRVPEMDPDADVVVVFGGTNDYGHGDAPLGEMNDRTVWTYYGALHVLFTALIEKYPAAQIVVLTPLHREDEEKRTPILKPFVDATRQVAEYYSLPVLDLWANYGIQPRIPVMKNMYVPDGLHPNDAGHAILANKLRAFLEQL